MRALIVSIAVLGAVIGVSTHALALNPQPLPPGMRPVQMLPHHIVAPKCPPGVRCLY